MDPAPACNSCGSLRHQRPNHGECPWNKLYDDEPQKRAELAAVVAAERAAAGLDVFVSATLINIDADDHGDQDGDDDGDVHDGSDEEELPVFTPDSRGGAAPRHPRSDTSPSTGRAGTPAVSSLTAPAPMGAFTPIATVASTHSTASVHSSRPPSGTASLRGGGSHASSPTPARTSTPSARRTPSPTSKMMAMMTSMFGTLLTKMNDEFDRRLPAGTAGPSASAAPPASATSAAVRAAYDAKHGITTTYPATAATATDTSFTCADGEPSGKSVKLSNTSNIPEAPVSTAGIGKWRRAFCRYLDANASGIGPLVCPDLYKPTSTRKFSRTAIACAIEAIRIAVTDTAAEDILDDIDDADVDPTTLMCMVVAYIKNNDTDSSIVLERNLTSIAPEAKGTRVEQIRQVHKDIKKVQRQYKAHGLIRGPDYFVTRARLLIAQHYPTLTFSDDRKFTTLQTLFQAYHHRASDADELESRTVSSNTSGGGAFPAVNVGDAAPVGGCRYCKGPHWWSKCPHTSTKTPVDGGGFRNYQGATCKHYCDMHGANNSHATKDCTGGKGGRKKREDYKKGVESTQGQLGKAQASHKAYVTEQEKMNAEHAAQQSELQAQLDASRALVARYQTTGYEQLPGGPP